MKANNATLQPQTGETPLNPGEIKLHNAFLYEFLLVNSLPYCGVSLTSLHVVSKVDYSLATSHYLCCEEKCSDEQFSENTRVCIIQ